MVGRLLLDRVIFDVCAVCWHWAGDQISTSARARDHSCFCRQTYTTKFGGLACGFQWGLAPRPSAEAGAPFPVAHCSHMQLPSASFRTSKLALRKWSCSSYALGHSCRTCTRPLDSSSRNIPTGMAVMRDARIQRTGLFKEIRPSLHPFFRALPVECVDYYVALRPS